MPRKWKPVSLTQRITIEGGYSPVAFPVKTMEFPGPDGADVTFVHISKDEEWILQSVVGKYDRHAMKRSKLLEQIKDKVSMDCSRPKRKDAVAADADADPMRLLDAIEAPTSKRSRIYQSSRGQNIARLVTMPAKEPNKYPNRRDEVQILVLPKSTNSLWLRLSDVVWLIDYLTDEVGPDGSQGVPVIDSEDEAPAGNCDVANVYIEWDFNDTVTATWLAGALKGRKVQTLISEFNQEKWEAMTELHKYGMTLAQANKTEKRNAVWHLLEQHCREQFAKHEEMVGVTFS